MSHEKPDNTTRSHVPDACGDPECEALCGPSGDGYKRCAAHATSNRVWEIGSVDSLVNVGFAVTLNYSPRTNRHLHFWFRVGDHGFAWERPRYNR